MLDHLAERAAAERLQQAVQRVYAEKRRLTPDVGGAASTAEFTSAVIDALGRQAHSECVVRVNESRQAHSKCVVRVNESRQAHSECVVRVNGESGSPSP
jgi:hypothetical protein